MQLVVLHPVEAGLLVIMLASSTFLWVSIKLKHERTTLKIEHMENKVNSGLHNIQCSLLTRDIEGFYRTHRDGLYIAEDDAKYLYELRDKLTELGVNSFSQRKVAILLEKEIK